MDFPATQAHRMSCRQAAVYLRLRGAAGRNYFYDDACRRYFRDCLLASAKAFRVALHTFLVMPNEAQVLSSPEMPGNVLAMLRSAELTYRAYYRGRFGSRCLQPKSRLTVTGISEPWLVADCHRFIESAPVREGLVEAPGQYSWSAYNLHAFGCNRTDVTLHASCKMLLPGGTDRFKSYREFISEPFSGTHLRCLEKSLLGRSSRGRREVASRDCQVAAPMGITSPSGSCPRSPAG